MWIRQPFRIFRNAGAWSRLDAFAGKQYLGVRLVLSIMQSQVALCKKNEYAIIYTNKYVWENI